MVSGGKQSISLTNAGSLRFMMGLHPVKPTVCWKYCKWKMHLTPNLPRIIATECTVGYWYTLSVLGNWDLWFWVPSSTEYIILPITSLEKNPNLKIIVIIIINLFFFCGAGELEEQFLPNTHCFHIIVKWENVKSNHTIRPLSWTSLVFIDAADLGMFSGLSCKWAVLLSVWIIS